jgi:hypothetical protein
MDSRDIGPVGIRQQVVRRRAAIIAAKRIPSNVGVQPLGCSGQAKAWTATAGAAACHKAYVTQKKTLPAPPRRKRKIEP